MFYRFLLILGLISGSVALAPASAEAQTRSLKIYFTHTKERATVTFKQNGRYVQSGLDQLNRLLRDWRRNEPTKMDPRLFDLVWEVYQASGSRDYIHVVSAYRSPTTNNMLRSRSSGVANNSQHTQGRAMDFFLPDVPVARIRELGMKFQVGGVGFYPRSGTPFIHLDTGGVRAWPRMSRQELTRIFPDGKTLHLPPDGRKLAGYDAALADYKRRMGSGAVQVAGGGSNNSDGSSGGRRNRNLLAMLFGGGDEDEDAAAIASSAPMPSAPVATARNQPQPAAAPQPSRQVAAVLPNSRNAPIPLFRPQVAAVAAPQVAALAPIAAPAAPVPAAPPADANLATATLPATPVPPTAIADVPVAAPTAPSSPQFTDLASLDIPRPEFIDRSGLAVYAAGDAPAFDGREVTDIAVAAAAAPLPTERAQTAEAIQTALVPLPGARPEFAALEAALDPAPASAETAAAAAPNTELARLDAAIDLPRADAAPLPVPQPVEAMAASAAAAETAAPRNEAISISSGAPVETELAALAPSSGAVSDDAAQALAQRMTSDTALKAPRKGGRPSATDAVQTGPKAVRTDPTLTETMISSWAIGRTRVAAVNRPVESPRFVNKELRTAPDTVYTTGFSAEAVDANRFTGAAVNFLSVARFKNAQ
jgi:uncharacterized protein YcbK (DUF882 family)